MKTTKVNIGMVENPKLAIIGDYWDEQIVSHIADLLREYQDLFPNTFSEIKGIDEELGEMKIPLREDAKLVNKWPYRLNPKYKEKVKEEIDKMLQAVIIEPVEEFEWINPIVIQDKKTRRIKLCVDLRKLNDACVTYPFLTPFTYEVLDSIGGQESYLFTDGFLGYHQIKIAKEKCHITTFAMDWGSYQYIVLPFGMKNTPSVFFHVVVATFKDFIHKFLEVYLDCCIVFGLIKKHVQKMRLMLD